MDILVYRSYKVESRVHAIHVHAKAKNNEHPRTNGSSQNLSSFRFSVNNTSYHIKEQDNGQTSRTDHFYYYYPISVIKNKIELKKTSKKINDLLRDVSLTECVKETKAKIKHRHAETFCIKREYWQCKQHYFLTLYNAYLILGNCFPVYSWFKYRNCILGEKTKKAV